MKVYDKPYTFIDGDVLDPRDLNGVWNYKREALKDAAARRYIESVFHLSFVKDCATGYTNTDTADTRTFSFTAPADLYVTRAFLSGVFSAIGAEIKVTITKNSAATTPDGCTDPWLNVSADAPTNGEVNDYSAARFKLEAGERYDVLLDSSAAFTVILLDVHFHVLSDRFGFLSANEPSFQPFMVSEDLTTIIGTHDENNNNFAAEVAKLGVNSYTPVCFPLHDTSVNPSASSLRKFPLPRISTDRSAATAVQMSLQIELASAVTGEYYAEICDFYGATLERVVVNLTSPAVSGYGSNTFSQTISTGTSGSAADINLDYFVQVKSENTATIKKAFVTLWIK